MRQDLLIKIRGHYDPVNSLSGGNQQKVMLGKWLIMNPDILILDEPTRGIDISAKSEIYTILNKLSKDGISILLISSEFLEIIGMCDRAIIMREGCIAGELEHSDLTESAIATLATVKSEGEA
jgi:ABC-type sugar transport system ATPase subunit